MSLRSPRIKDAADHAKKLQKEKQNQLKKAKADAVNQQFESGLWDTTCSVVTAIPTYTGIDAFNAEVEAGRVDYNYPYIITNVDELIANGSTPPKMKVMSTLRTKLPVSQQKKDRIKATAKIPQSIQTMLAASMMRGAPNRIKFDFEPSQFIQMWGGNEDFDEVALERNACGNLRVTMEGTREVCIASYSDVFAWAHAINKEAGEKDMAFSADFTPLHLIREFFRQKLPTIGYTVMETVGGKLFRGTVGPGTIMAIPAASVVMDKAIGGDKVIGFRAMIVEDDRANGRLHELRTHLEGIGWTDKNSDMLKCFNQIVSVIAGHETLARAQAQRYSKPWEDTSCLSHLRA